MAKRKKPSSPVPAIEPEVEVLDVAPLQEEDPPSLESRSTDFLNAYARPILYGIVTIALLLVVGYYITDSSRHQVRRDFMNAEHLYSGLQAEASQPETDEAASELSRLLELLSIHPELRSKYDGAVAHTLLKRNNGSHALHYANSSMARHSGNSGPDKLKLFQDYAKTSLAISQHKHEEALQQSRELQEKLHDNPQLQVLQAFNSLRVATLAQQLSLHEQEREAWKALNGILNNRKPSPQLHNVQRHLSVGTVSLQNYSSARQQDLQS